MTARGRVLAAAAAASLAAAGAFAWSALRSLPPEASAGGLPAAPARPRSPADREAMDVVGAAGAGSFAAALNGVVSFLSRFRPGSLAAELQEPFEEARIAAGRWGLSEASDLAAGGEGAGAEALLEKAALALAGTSAEGEVAGARLRTAEALAAFLASDGERRRVDALVPAQKAVEAARATAAAAGPAKAVAELRGVLKATTDPAARKVVEGEIAILQGRVAGARARAALRKKADAALAGGDYRRAREILEGLAAGGGDGGADPAEAARDAAKAEGLKDLEENREPEALAAVRRGLRWMVKQQLPDGSFSIPLLDDAGKTLDDARRKQAKYRTGITGLAALALLGHVRHDITDEFEPALDRTLSWILAAQKADGSFARSIYEHSLCTLALVDADRLLHRTKLREPARKAVAWLEEAMNLDGGWRYAPRTPPSDVSATGWALQALLHARMGSYEVKPAVVDLAFSYLDRMSDVATGRAGYTSPGQGSLAMTAATLFCRLRNGMGPADPVVEKAADLLLKTLPRAGWSETSYHLYYASDAMSRLGGKWWKAWAPPLKAFLLKSQVAEGEAAGAWPTKDDRWARDAGGVYQAAMNALCLENFFEHRD